MERVPDKLLDTAGRPPAACFATTHWSMVVQAADSQSPESTLAMERLCQRYWYPLYSFVRLKGNLHEDSSDLTQAFFAKFWRSTTSNRWT